MIADIPGLVEGAADGVGLGLDFLRHLARTNLLVHMVELSPEDPEDCWHRFDLLQKEVKRSPHDVLSKPQVVVLSKTDLPLDYPIETVLSLFQKNGINPICISSETGDGVDNLIELLFEKMSQLNNG